MMLAFMAAIVMGADPVLTVSTIEGNTFPLADAPVTVVVFLASDCPIANKSQPALQKAYTRFKDQGIRMAGVYIDPRESLDELLRHRRDYRFSYEQIHDAEHKLVKHLKASVTPQAFVLDRNGVIQYRGRINNAYADLGVRQEVTSHDLEEAIEAVLAGRKPKIKETTAIGCAIPDLDDFR